MPVVEFKYFENICQHFKPAKNQRGHLQVTTLECETIIALM